MLCVWKKRKEVRKALSADRWTQLIRAPRPRRCFQDETIKIEVVLPPQITVKLHNYDTVHWGAGCLALRTKNGRFKNCFIPGGILPTNPTCSPEFVDMGVIDSLTTHYTSHQLTNTC